MDPSIISYQAAPGADVVVADDAGAEIAEDEVVLNRKNVYTIDTLLVLKDSPLVKVPEELQMADLAMM